VVLRKLTVPEAVRNGSRSHLVLDCDYELDRSSDGEGGVILKWYRNGDTIYQWVPPRRPQVSQSVLKSSMKTFLRFL